MTIAPSEGTEQGDAPGAFARRAIGYGVTITLVFAVAGLAGIPRARSIFSATISLFFTQFGQIELLPLLLVVAFTIWLYTVVRSGNGEIAPWREETEYRPWIVAAIACATTIVALIGIRWLFRGFIMADDEFAGWFQALIFAKVKMRGTIPPEWCRFANPITPTSVLNGADCTWYVGSLFPVHSLLQAPFIALGVSRLGVPLSAGISVWLAASIARQLWPDRPSRAYLAAVFLATSTQLLIMSMTMFAMASHLLLTMIFLRVYVDRRPKVQLLVPWVGAVALGVHSPLPHLFLVPPFLLRYARDRRWKMFAYVVVVYAIALAGWSIYAGYTTKGLGLEPHVLAAPSPQAYVGAYPNALRKMINFPTPIHLFAMTLQLALIPTWNNLLLVTLIIAAMLRWKTLDNFSRDAALCIILTIFARSMTRNLQGEGWGYRMIYANLGAMALLAAVGVDQLREAVGSQVARRLVLASAALAVFVQLPVRVYGVNQIMGPYRDGYEWMSTLDYDIAVLPTEYIAWGRQLIRNDPFLRNRPVIVNFPQVEQKDVGPLTRWPGKKVKLISRPEIRSKGFPPGLMFFGGIIIKQE